MPIVQIAFIVIDMKLYANSLYIFLISGFILQHSKARHEIAQIKGHQANSEPPHNALSTLNQGVVIS